MQVFSSVFTFLTNDKVFNLNPDSPYLLNSVTCIVKMSSKAQPLLKYNSKNQSLPM